MKTPFEQHGALSWFELMTTDPVAAQSFYTQLFGWEVKEGSIAGVDYNVISLEGKEVGGLMPLPPNAKGMPPMWGIYITVDDLEVTLQQCAKLGGKTLMPPMDIPGVGKMALIQDPQGAVLSIITYTQTP